MELSKRLPDSEFQIMKILWKNTPPVTTSVIMSQLSPEKQWKIATVISFLTRLTEKGFVKSDKKGKERLYYPLITKQEYLDFETKNFMKQYHNNSFFSFVNTFYGGEKVDSKELDNLLKWAKEKEQ